MLYQFKVEWSYLLNLLYFMPVIVILILVIVCESKGNNNSKTLFGTTEKTFFDKINVPKSLKAARAVGGLVFAIMLLIFFLFNFIKCNTYIYKRIKTDNYYVVVGTVYNFEETDSNGDEYFVIDNVEFYYNKRNWLGYHTLQKDGGVITGNNQRLKIYYIPYKGNNVIVRIDEY